MTRNLFAGITCAAACSQAYALLSVNVLQDDTTVPGWVINTFTVDSDTDVTVAEALSRLDSGSMLQVPGIFNSRQSNGLGDSFFNINNDGLTIAGLGAGDLGNSNAIFDSTGISQTWFNIRTSDIGTDMHLATLTFSDDAVGDFDLIVASGQGQRNSSYSILNGFIDLTSTIDPRPIPIPPDNPNPPSNPGGNPGTGGTPPNPGSSGNPGSNTIPEPVGLGLIALAAAAFGGLHRRRLGHQRV